MKKRTFFQRLFSFKMILFCIISGLCLSSCNLPGTEIKSEVLMKKAVPVWADGMETEMNVTIGFQGAFNAGSKEECQLRITASTLYRVFLNGEFVGYGPARAAHGYFRVDEYDLSEYVNDGENIIAIEVAGYNINSFYTLDQPSFLQAEVESGSRILLATGRENDFNAHRIDERLQKVERYSFQRPFTEYYRMKANVNQWKRSAGSMDESLVLTQQPTVRLLPRNLLLPEFVRIRPATLYSTGTIEFIRPDQYYKDRSLTNISEKLKGFREEEIDIFPSQFIQEIVNKTHTIENNPYNGEPVRLTKHSFCTVDLGTNLSGFIGGHISCEVPSTVVLYFDEKLTDGDVNTKKRMDDINNQVVYELEPGEYHLETFESYTLKFLKVIILEGEIQLKDLYLREYAYPENPLATFSSDNKNLNHIFKAAKQTSRQNAVDVLMDCPSRERAGWLCDSYFAAITEKDFTGKSAVTHNFLESYVQADSFAYLPEGMLPMCYPSDHNPGIFIPNYALWFIIQIADYIRLGGDPDLVVRLQPRIEKLLDYFTGFENEDGLLEKLDGWIFVEWSRANGFVRDVNYPTNMLYSRALKTAYELYGSKDWLAKSEHVRQMVLEQSFDGTFFVDNAVRNKDGELRITGNKTEVCQYYAFFFDFATPESHPELWTRLIDEFGPGRNVQQTYPDVFIANAFMGNYMRMDLLSRYGLQDKMLAEMESYFFPMAEETGTLWERMDDHASCNHGFASYLGHILYRDALGVREIDYLNRRVTLQFNDIDMKECSGTIPIEDDHIEVKWVRNDNKISYSVSAPDNYNVKIVNPDGFELTEL
jgi:alpha-L-rhamnosidase